MATNNALNTPVVNATSYTPTITTSGTSPTTLTFSTQFGRYYAIGPLCHFVANIVVNAFTIGGGTGNIQVSIPIAAGAFSPASLLNVQIQNCTIGVTTQSLNGTIASGASVLTISQNITIATVTPLPLSALSATAIITVSGTYFIS